MYSGANLATMRTVCKYNMQRFFNRCNVIMNQSMVPRHIAKTTVFEDHFTVDFKSGITSDIEA